MIFIDSFEAKHSIWNQIHLNWIFRLDSQSTRKNVERKHCVHIFVITAQAHVWLINIFTGVFTNILHIFLFSFSYPILNIWFCLNGFEIVYQTVLHSCLLEIFPNQTKPSDWNWIEITSVCDWWNAEYIVSFRWVFGESIFNHYNIGLQTDL